MTPSGPFAVEYRDKHTLRHSRPYKLLGDAIDREHADRRKAILNGETTSIVRVLKDGTYAALVLEVTQMGVPVTHCLECGKRHPETRSHCVTCGRATAFLNPQAECITCGNKDRRNQYQNTPTQTGIDTIGERQ